MLTASRTGPTEGEVSVRYATRPATARAGTDFEAVTGTLTWADGEAGDKTFTVPILDDGLNEGRELFHVDLTDPVGGPGLGAHVHHVVNGQARFDRRLLPGRINLQVTVEAEIPDDADRQGRVTSGDLIEPGRCHGRGGCEATGVPGLVQTAVRLVAQAGRVVVVGLSAEDAPLRVGDLAFREIDVLGVSCCNGDEFAEAASLVARRRDALAGLVTHEFSLDETPVAIDYAIRHPAEVMKAMIRLEGA